MDVTPPGLRDEMPSRLCAPVCRPRVNKPQRQVPSGVGKTERSQKASGHSGHAHMSAHSVWGANFDHALRRILGDVMGQIVLLILLDSGAQGNR